MPSHKQKKVLWNEEHHRILEWLKDCLVEPPGLGFFGIFHSYSSTTQKPQTKVSGLFYSNKGDKLSVIAYGSWTLTDIEQNYHLHSRKLVFLALKWAITGHSEITCIIRLLSLYSVIIILSHVLSSAKLNATGCRWVAELEDFHFTIRYRPGKDNMDAYSHKCLWKLRRWWDGVLKNWHQSMWQRQPKLLRLKTPAHLGSSSALLLSNVQLWGRKCEIHSRTLRSDKQSKMTRTLVL